MQYIDVIVDTKTQKIYQTFTYKVTPELLPGIKLGVLVEVPFGNKNKEGIVLDIKRYPSTSLRVDKLKFIKKIIDPTPIVDSIRLELAKWMSRYYLTSLAKVIFFMVPGVARREIKKNVILSPDEIIGINSTKNLSRMRGLKRVERSFANAQDDNGIKIYGLYNSKQTRIQNYIHLIQKAREKNKGVILLFPDWQANKKYIDTIYDRFRNDAVLLDPNKTKTEFFRTWNELLKDKKSIAIGTRNSIFAPVNNLGLIIVDEPKDFGYKEEQIVHYHVCEVSRYLSKITDANLIYGSNIPQLTDYHLQKFNKIKILSHSNVLQNTRINNNLSVIDGSQEKSLIGYQIEQIISRALKRKQKILIFINRKNQGFLCADCSFIFRCPRCNSVLQLQKNILVCSQCNYKKIPPAQCPECRGHNLRSFGSSIESIKKELNKLFSNNKILVSTSEIFRHQGLQFDLIIVPSWEHLQFGSDFNEKKNILNTVAKLLEITQDKLIIQTNNLEDEFLQNIKDGNLDIIYDRELNERKKYHYPPFYKLIKFIYKNKDSKIAEKEINKLYNILLSFLPRCNNRDKLRQESTNRFQIEILGPSETRKLRDKFYWQIVLKIPAKLYPQANKLFISREKELNLSKYLIDVDPLRLL